MKITPLDIRRKEFKRSMRGYSDEEVDIFLDEVADEFERIFQENMELQDRAHRLDEQIAGHVQLKDALEKTLISAQLQAEELRANAHKESELILRDAELKARGIVSSSYTETQRTQQALVQLKLLEEDFRFKFRSLLEGYLRLLNNASLTVTATDPGGLAAAAVAAAPPPTPEPVTPEPVAAEPVPAEPVAVQSEAVASLVPEAAAARASTVPVESMEERQVRTPVPPPVPGPVADAGEAAPVGGFAARFDDHWPTAALDEDVATEESPPPLVDTEPPPMRPVSQDAGPSMGYGSSSEESTAESTPPSALPPDDASREVDAPRGFFFGRRMDDMDDTFPGDDVGKKDRARDFEW